MFAADPIADGEIELDGKRLRLRSPSDAIAAGIGYLTRRPGDGLAMQLPVTQNITLAHVPGDGIWIDRGAERRTGRAASRRARHPHPVAPATGGDAVGRHPAEGGGRPLETESRVLLFDEPSRGIDVGAKAEMFKLIGSLAADGRAIVLISPTYRSSPTCATGSW